MSDAALCHVKRTITRIELGQHEVVFSTLEKILAAMGYTLEDILPDEPAETATATARVRSPLTSSSSW